MWGLGKPSISSALYKTIAFLLFRIPSSPWWFIIIILTLRIFVFSVLFRRYLGPWILARISKHIRVRSVSLRSLRGIYVFRTGRHRSQCWRIGRIGWTWSASASRHLVIKIEDVSVTINPLQQHPQTHISHKRSVHRMLDYTGEKSWDVLFWIITVLDPYVRPVIRTFAVDWLQRLTMLIPRILSAIAFDVNSIEIIYEGEPTIQVSTERIELQTSLQFLSIQQPTTAQKKKRTPSHSFRRSYSMAAWRSRLGNSFRRTWNRVADEKEVQANLSVKFQNIQGTLPSRPDVAKFFQIPGSIVVDTSMSFDLRRHIFKAHSLTTDARIGNCLVELSPILDIITALKGQGDSNGEHNPLEPSLPQPRTLSSLQIPLAPVTPLSAKSPDSVYSLYSPRTPRSPFQTVSASLLPRRHNYSPCMKLKDTQRKASLSFLDNFRVQISALIFTLQPDSHGIIPEKHVVAVRNVAVIAGLSDPQKDRLHSCWFGRNIHSEAFDSDVYSGSLVVDTLDITRHTGRETIDVLSLSKFDWQVLTTQWPSPFLVTSPFIGGDPNSPAVITRLSVGSVNVTERLDTLLRYAQSQSRSPPVTGDVPATPHTALPIPRFVIEAHCGPISGTFLLGSESGSGPVLGVKTGGFSFNSRSYFTTISGRFNPIGDLFDHVQLRTQISSYFSLAPTFIRARQSQVSSNPRFSSLTEDPSIVSLEALEVSLDSSALATIRDDTQNTACVNLATLESSISCFTDTLSVELWHPLVIEALRHLLPATSSQTSSSPSRPRTTTKHPFNGSLDASVQRIVVFLTAPSINPNDHSGLSSGVAITIQGSSLKHRSFNSMDLDSIWKSNQKYWECRNHLKLSEDPNIPVLSNAMSSKVNAPSSYSRLTIPGVVVRSAVSNRYATDDPFIAERDDPDLKELRFLQLHDVQINATHKAHSSEIDVEIASLELTVKLSHIYHTMLALQFVKYLTQRPGATSKSSRRSHTLALNLTIDSVSILSQLLEEQAFCRIDSVKARHGLGVPLEAQWAKLVVAVRVPSAVSRWEEDCGYRWEQFIVLNGWTVSLGDGPENLSVAVTGNLARLRIPHGFVLANLIRDVTVAVKACKHLLRITSLGVQIPFPEPEVEGPKSVPSISVQIAFFCVEAVDDPLESKLCLIFRAGPKAVDARSDRERAFAAKVESIVGPGNRGEEDEELPWQFTSKHSVSIQEARSRLDRVHVLDWIMRLDHVKAGQAVAEEEVRQRFRASSTRSIFHHISNVVEVSSMSDAPPLFRATFNDLSLFIDKPSFPENKLSDFLFEQGSLPKETQFSLLVPLHIALSLSSLKINLRDYPVALAHISSPSNFTNPALVFDTDLVIAEEMGLASSVDWVTCPIVGGNGISSEMDLMISVPKTIMPVKTYANAHIRVMTPNTSSFAWAVSSSPAIQDLVRVIESVTSSPKDPSPPLGFWDKMRLVFHWTLTAAFKGEVRYHMKGLRDPYEITGTGAGLVYSWRGNTKLHVGVKNESNELIQVISDSLFIAIPELRIFPEPQSVPFRKICAKFSSGVRFGVGFALERACGPECPTCTGSAFHRSCRYFTFKPHHQVRLEIKDSNPTPHCPTDSYSEFRSDFIHLSISLNSSIRKVHSVPDANSLYLTPKAFSHFYSWWGLFNGVLSLPVRLGTYYESRTISPKFGRHVATIKYRLHVPKLNVIHGYIDDSKETWVDGETPWLGVKAMIDELQVDMHQRDQETIVPDSDSPAAKNVRRKPFYAAELVMKGLDLRAVLATFHEPQKKDIDISTPSQKSNYRTRTDLPTIDKTSPWHDDDDFIETDWSPPAQSGGPELHVLPVASCFQFAYFKRNSANTEDPTQRSKFGDEDTHNCLLGKQKSVPQVQLALASGRVAELQRQKCRDSDQKRDQQRKINLLEHYIETLQKAEQSPPDKSSTDYQMPADFVSPDEWAEFDNVYQIHAPKLFLDSAIRDIMMQYYHCSRARRGFEYHMATRAVKFIRDQARAVMVQAEEVSGKVPHHPTAQAAASAIRKIFQDLSGESGKSGRVPLALQVSRTSQSSALDPMVGWAEGVSLQKGHCCHLLKPQIVLHNRDVEKDMCVVTAVQVKLQSFTIMDDANRDDPVSGKVMSRTYAVLSGMQTFAPTFVTGVDDSYVPLEVLVDLRCESDEFERLVPQTDATLHYDKFNRLRLRNNVTSVARRSSSDSSGSMNHLQDQMDLLQVHIPNFTVTANDKQFHAISNIVTKVLLFSDAAHKTRIDKLNTLMFTYDFDDLPSSATVISDLQHRIRTALEIQHGARNSGRTGEDGMSHELMKLRAHIVSLTEELNLIFEAIKYAQDRSDEHTDRKSALLLKATSTEISWRMLDDKKELLAKLVIQHIDYAWMSRQDSSTVNNLSVGNLQAFDGSRDALWAEIVSKHDEPSNHPLLKRNLFLTAYWVVLPPVGGITIYEIFELNFHPLRLQIDARVGTRIMEYMWPARKNRQKAIENDDESDVQTPDIVPRRASVDSPSTPYAMSRQGSESDAPARLAPPLRRLGASRSFTDLRSSANESSYLMLPPLHKTRSTESLRDVTASSEPLRPKSRAGSIYNPDTKAGDAAEMRTRSSQKTFVFVKISSLHLVLNVMKEDSFVCNDARIRTRDLEYRNQTWSFEEFVNQFIPSDMSWKSLVKMAIHQPLVPVIPVARELISKTKWIANKSGTSLPTNEPQPNTPLRRLKAPTRNATPDDSEHEESTPRSSLGQKAGLHTRFNRTSKRTPEPLSITGTPFTLEPRSSGDVPPSQPRKRMMSLFNRNSSRPGRKSSESSRPSTSNSGRKSLDTNAR